jgi:hypothetical protein
VGDSSNRDSRGDWRIYKCGLTLFSSGQPTAFRRGQPLISHVSQTITREEMMLPDKQKKAYKAFYDSARHNEYFNEKTTILLHLASAFAIGCYP